MARITAPLATRVRSMLRAAEHPQSAQGTATEWRTARDRWLDALDPREEPTLDEGELRRLIDFLSEAAPSRSSRRTPQEWSAAIDALVPELLFAAHAAQTAHTAHTAQTAQTAQTVETTRRDGDR
ncbi:hypothetical protein [Galbitalea soli]|uniref:Uncharacterized protein n=1 Tax=Galbitalea soli TaxID=1268042 RepID=A0A7C9TNG8_9MICO|nr:hypothetical protein [Galbitalea soli]NEM90118.1 hypothetical protein [Galbitalea soli]NYJ30825.1 hypothetical protein [Galbitalea soli]